MGYDRDWHYYDYMPEDQLWVCECCGAECNADCVGDRCPACDIEIDETTN